MSNSHANQRSGFTQTIQKLLLSGFVVLSFAAYVIHQRFTYPDSPLVATSVSPTTAEQSLPAQASSGLDGSANNNFPTPTNSTSNVAQQPATQIPIPATAIPTGQYKDGVYAGPQIDAYYGMVKVQATIQNGKIASVQFLEYPSDRRTSQRINSIAMPWLQQEAIQAQSASVNLISGATLTSEAFVYSLDAALRTAKN